MKPEENTERIKYFLQASEKREIVLRSKPEPLTRREQFELDMLGADITRAKRALKKEKEK